MNIFKKLFGKSSKKASSDENVIAVQNIIPIVNYASEGDSLFGKLSATAQLAMLSGFKGLSDEQEKSVFNEINEACKDSTNPGDLNTLALLYFNGTGVVRNIDKGVELLKEAAEKGNTAAMDNLGNFYNSNWGDNDLDTAMQWWLKAAEKGFGPSQATLGRLFKERGDYEQARYWVDKGVAQGNADAEYIMGTFYTHGYGVDVDYNEAIKWYKKAAEKGHSRAQTDVAVCYANGEGVEKDEQQMVYWYEKAAEQGDPVGLRGLYLCYKDGTGVPQDNEKSFEYLQRAADSGLDLAQHEMGLYYLAKEDYHNAIKWYTKAAEQGFARSQSEIAIMYMKGEGLPRSTKKAIYWFEQASKQGHAGAQNNLASLYFDKRNFENAFYWWQKSAEGGNVDAMANLAECYLKGAGTEQNILKALHYLKSAADLGDQPSANLLQELYQKMGNALPIYLLSEALNTKKIIFPTITSLLPLEFIDNPEYTLQECEKGNSEAQVFAAFAYRSGSHGFERNEKECMRWLNEASQNDNPQANNNLATELLMKNNYARAIELYHRAAKQDIDAAMYNLGMCYALGVGVQQSMDRAMEWLNKAADLGHQVAPKAIAIINGENVE